MKFLSQRRRWLLALLVLPVLSIGPAAHEAQSADKPDEAVDRAAAAMYEGIRTETLPNGLRVYIKQVPNSAVVATMVAYKVGSADEDKEFTGLSHYLEHLMFKGTDKLVPGDIDRQTLRSGGHNNAYTSEDYTVYHFDFAAEQWEVPLKIEADRMRNLRIDKKHEFEQEKGAVCAELDRNEDGPWDLEGKMILPLLFGPKGPYGHPVIGERKHVHAATAEVVKAHYDKWYHPNNAALVVVGGIDPDKVLAKIKELFGPIPQGKLPERKAYTPLTRKAPAREKMTNKFEVPRVLIGYNTIKTGDPDYYALEVAQAVLSGGKTSRLYKNLVEGAEIASAAEASNSTGRYPGWFGLYIELLKGKDLQKAEDLTLIELRRLRDEPISAAELKRVKQQLFASVIFGREGVHSLADSVARGVTTNDLDFLKKYLPRIAAVTPEQVQKVAQKYFDPQQRVVVWSVPKPAGKEGAREGRVGSGEWGVARGEGSGEWGVASGRPQSSIKNVLARGLQRLAAGDKEVGDVPFSLKNAQRVELPNGLTLLLFENRRLPIFVAQALVKDVRLREADDKAGVATLVGRLLDEGTSKHKGPEIAELIENVGGGLAFSSSGGSVKVLAPDRKLGLGLLFECLTEANFPKDAFNRQREQLLSEIAEADSQPDSKAAQLYRGMVYGKHPFGRPSTGTLKTVKPLTPDDCKAFHKQLFVPNNTVVAVVGDFDSKQVIEEIKSLTADWKKVPLAKLDVTAATAPEKFIEKVVTMPEAAQLHFYMGHPGIRRANPDFYKLLVMDYVLGTGPGFTDRLSSTIRDREGLAYTVSANITNSASEEAGLFTCYIGTEPKNFAKVKAMFLKELVRIRAETPTKEEVEDAKKYLLGSLPFSYTTNEQIAGQLVGIERHGLGFDYLDKYRKSVGAVTPEDVQAVAKKYLNPERMVLVVAGAVDQNGKALEKVPSPKDK